MRIIHILALIICFNTSAQILNVDGCYSLSEDAVYQEVYFISECSSLVIEPNITLTVNGAIYGTGNIFGRHTNLDHHYLEVNGCLFEDFEGGININENVQFTFNQGDCQTLNLVEFREFEWNDWEIAEFRCIVYNTLGQKLHEGKFKDFRKQYNAFLFVYFPDFKHTIKRIWIKS